MHNMKKIAIVAISIILSGCILPYPHNNWKSPAVYGYVKDKDTGKPIAGVRVEVKGDPSRSVITNADGFYELPPIKDFDWFVVICPGPCDGMSGNFVVAVTYQGYTTEEEEIMGCIGHPDSVCNGRKENVDFSLQKGI